MTGRRKEKKRPTWVSTTPLEELPATREDCPCTKRKCERHGKCRECYEFHSGGRRPPYCLR